MQTSEPMAPQSAATPAPPAAQKVPRRLLAGVAAAVLVLAAAGYSFTGSPTLATPSGIAAAEDAAAAARNPGAEQIAAMVDKLAERLKQNPNDGEGFTMLGRSYVVLGRFPEAVEAYRKALALRGDDAALLADLADALAVANGRDLRGEPMALIDRALKLDPVNLKALSLAGTDAFGRQDFKAAVDYWQRLVAASPADAPYLPQLQASIDEARRQGGLAPAPAAAASSPAAVAAANASVSGRVTLSPKLKGLAAPDDTVFVYARAADGPRMPLAMLRKQVKDLPITFTLDDSTAMSPQMRLSAFPRVVITARVSKSGDAMPQPGDLAAQSAPVALGTGDVALEISQIVEK